MTLAALEPIVHHRPCLERIEELVEELVGEQQVYPRTMKRLLHGTA